MELRLVLCQHFQQIVSSSVPQNIFSILHSFDAGLILLGRFIFSYCDITLLGNFLFYVLNLNELYASHKKLRYDQIDLIIKSNEFFLPGSPSPRCLHILLPLLSRLWVRGVRRVHCHLGFLPSLGAQVSQDILAVPLLPYSCICTSLCRSVTHCKCLLGEILCEGCGARIVFFVAIDFANKRFSA